MTATVLLARTTFRFVYYHAKLHAVAERYFLQIQDLRDTSFTSFEPSAAFLNLLDLKFQNSAPLEKNKIAYNKNNHMQNKSDLRHLLAVQSAMYETLNLWNQLVDELQIHRWTAHGGSAIGAKCFGGMNPWDDDIDLTVLDCTLIDQLWEKGDEDISCRYPTLDSKSHSMNNSQAVWDSRLIKVMGKDMILSKGSKCCNWYKFMSTKQAYLWKPGNDIMGIDVECMSRGSSWREKVAMDQSGWTDYMKSKGELATVPFGPTTIQLMEPKILNQYIRLRYGKSSPCQYPYTNGVEAEKFPAVSLSHGKNQTPSSMLTMRQVFKMDQDQAKMDFVLEHWYYSKFKRNEWLNNKGNKKQMEYTKQLTNLDKIEVDNTISPDGCSWRRNARNTPIIKVIGWNAERGTHWDKFYTLVQEREELSDPLVILMNEMDVGMARSGNVHTTRRLAVQMGMNYAYGVEFLELTRGTREEQEATIGKRDALGLHGNAILSKCILGDAMILRDELPSQYFSDKAERGINANGFEVRLGGRMGLFARIFERPRPLVPKMHDFTPDNFDVLKNLPPHFVVGNIHKLGETDWNRKFLWNYFGFGPPPPTSKNNDGLGVDGSPSQHGVVVQGDFGPNLCSLGGLTNMNDLKRHKTFRVKCFPEERVKVGPLSADYFCSDMLGTRDVIVTPPCDWSNKTHPLTMADHAIVSIELKSNKF